ncbi:helix-turn-helix domain-containing protein [Fibrella sp. HMF5036]|uniref:Helix-turn-helix domain-containing protein n=2 Tax=Fibrella aquatilis TaxID=2817059 RepID=A0A939JXM6_9BACT|nr:helix-turn-helix domain-containing protein [Fibrella aquatilis]
MTIQKPIRTEAEYDDALAELDSVWETKMHTPEGDLKEVLVLLIDDYENKHHPILPLSPLEAIRYQMEEKGLSQQDVAPYFGGKNRVSEVLNGKRNLTLKMVREISKHLNIPPADRLDLGL